MGWSVNVTPVVLYQVTCSDCGWASPEPLWSEAQAEQLRGRHVRAHQQRWQEYNEAIERGEQCPWTSADECSTATERGGAAPVACVLHAPFQVVPS